MTQTEKTQSSKTQKLSLIEIKETETGFDSHVQGTSESFRVMLAIALTEASASMKVKPLELLQEMITLFEINDVIKDIVNHTVQDILKDVSLDRRANINSDDKAS